jgi:hypothetical protein
MYFNHAVERVKVKSQATLHTPHKVKVCTVKVIKLFAFVPLQTCPVFAGNPPQVISRLRTWWQSAPLGKVGQMKRDVDEEFPVFAEIRDPDSRGEGIFKACGASLDMPYVSELL